MVVTLIITLVEGHGGNAHAIRVGKHKLK